ncbi:MAG: DUF4301 family protein [Acidobacteriota bacterium]
MADTESREAAESATKAAADLSPQDTVQIERHGLTVEEVTRQLAFFREPPAPTRLARACTPGDGIIRLDEARWPRLQELYGDAAAAGRFSKFVPASGAASRMFKALVTAHRGDGRDEHATAAADRLLAEADRFPFVADLEAELDRRGESLDDLRRHRDAGPALAALLDEDGLDYASTAKALIPFHADRDGAYTALEEHLIEAAEHLRDKARRCRVHFTIPQHQELLFRERLREIAGRLEARFKASFDLSTSIQSPETDTVAGAVDGGPFRDGEGRLVFRPGGHGALLHNLAGLGGDLVFIRNIDNIQPEHRRREVLRWNRILGGFLVETERRIVELLGRVERSRGGAGLSDAIDEAAELLGRGDIRNWHTRPAAAQQAFLVDLLDRPLRIAGMVPNIGDPGGGPFWVANKDGAVTAQVVETSQIDMGDPDQASIVGGATHFNPVHLLCRLRSHRGEAYELSRFVDQEAVFVARKSLAGRELLALERPGLWNGAMAGWNTLFVEVPQEIFAPVKTVFDLLGPAHQPAP